MDSSTISVADQKNVACPECGGDACILQDTRRGWTHRSRVIPRVLWIVMCIGLVGYWISIGHWGYQLGKTARRAQATPNPRATTGGPVYTTLYPFGIGNREDSSLVSTRDLQDAIDGDEASLAAVISKFDEPTQWSAAVQGRSKIESLQFGLKEPYGTLSSSIWFSFGGTLLQSSTNIMVQDLRDPDSIGRNPYQGNWGGGGWKFFPRCQYSKLESNGAVQSTYSMDVRNIFGVLSICMVFSVLIRALGGVCGLRIAHTRWFAPSICLFLIVSAAIAGSLGKEEHSSINSNHQQDIAQSSSYPIEELRNAVHDPSLALKICQELLDLVPPNHNGDLLLAQGWIVEPYKGRWASPVDSYLQGSIGYQNILLTIQRRSFPEINSGEEIPVRLHEPFWRGIQASGTAVIQWGEPEDQWRVRIGLFRLVSIGVLFWLIWRMFHWGSIVAFRRIQHHRVLRNECIFCAYPLTADAVNARYPAEET